MTLKLPRANVLRGNAIPGSKITTFPKRSTEALVGPCCRVVYRLMDLDQDLDLDTQLNNSKRVESQTQLATKFGSTSKSSKIIPVLIQTWTTRVLYNHERSRCSIMFCTMFFSVTKLPQTPRSFSNNTSFSQNKVPASRNMMESRNFCSTSHSFQ